MIKKIIFSLIVFFSFLGVAPSVFADNGFPDLTDYTLIDSTSPGFLNSCSFTPSSDSVYSAVLEIGSVTDGRSFYDGYFSPSASDYSPWTNKKFVDSNNDCNGSTYWNSDSSWSNLSNGNYIFVIYSVTQSPIQYNGYWYYKVLGTQEVKYTDGVLEKVNTTPPALVSDIDKITLYTLNNEDLSEITTPIPFDAGHQIHFFNYEEDSYHYLAYNMTICHNGQLEGCTVNNETFVEDVIDISSLGFSSSGEPPLSVKLNFKDVVTQSDLVNITWFLTNCPNTYSTCPDGVSDGRGYTYLINDSLASDSWLTFDDPARPECSIARLDVCLINAVNYFIKPRTSGFANSFSVAHTRINERIPFVYLYAVRDSFTEIFNSPTASVNWSVSFGSLGSLTVLDSDSFSGSPYYSFFTGMRVYLSYLLWILLGVGLYKRAVRLFDDKTVA